MKIALKSIASIDNPKIKHLAKLVEKKRERQSEGVWIVEGQRELDRAWEANVIFKAFYFCREYIRKNDFEQWIQRADSKNIQVFELTDKVFKKLSQRESPDGFLAEVIAPTYSLKDFSVKENTLFVMVEGIEKPGNLGSLIRTVEAAGAAALIVCDAAIDLGNPAVIRNSQGLIFEVPVIFTNQAELVEWVSKFKIKTIATTPDSTAKIYWQADMRGRVIILAGTESTGLSNFWLNRADVRVRISMMGVGDSLNVGVATALVLYEALRQNA
jgi:RNA methyltransferase, TrmH family